VVGPAVALSLMALRRTGHASREHARLSASTCTWASTITSTASRQGEDEPSPPAAPCFSLSPSVAAVKPCHQITLQTITSIQFIASTASPSCPPAAQPPPSLEASMAKLQFGVFSVVVPIRPCLAIDVGSPPTDHPKLIHLHH